VKGIGRRRVVGRSPGQGPAGRLRVEDADFVVGPAGGRLQRPRGLAHALLIVVVLFFVVAFAWASHASLEEVTRGDARVIPSSQVQVVQNLEGGIVAEIAVREGAIVEAGEVLLRIENILAASDLRENRIRHLALLGTIARLEAEIEVRDLVFPEIVLAQASEVANNERALFLARRAAHESELAVLRSQAVQRERELAELAVRTTQLERSLALAREELALTEPLAAQRVVPKIDLLRLRREVNELEGELAANQERVPRVEAALAEVFKRVDERQSAFKAEAQRELNAVQAEADALSETIGAAADRVQRTEVRSPVRGTVQRLLVNTVGGVIQPGEDLVEIVPLEDTLLVEARIRPADIAFLRPGLPAVVKITAYDYSIYGGLDGVVEDISADTIVDQNGEGFYRVRVRTEESAITAGAGPLPIIPGMTAQVDILTGRKTVLDYLLKPLRRAHERALRER
jgi:adhesin transport system membrane fusion protein